MVRNARYNVLNAVAAAVSMNLINPYIGIFAVKLGADNLQLGYLSSWPQLVSVVAVLGAASAVARSRAKQRLIAAIFLFGRLAALGAAAVPWFPESSRVWALIAFWVLFIFPNSAGGPALQSYLADVFPASERVKVFAARNSWSTGAGMVVVLLSGWLLDKLFDYPTGYQVMFLLSFVVAVFEILFFLRMKEPAVPQDAEHAASHAPAAVGFKTYLSAFQHRPFLLFLLCSIPFHFTWQMAWPIFTRFQVSELYADNTWLSMITVANSLVAMLAYPRLARQGEKRGNMTMMAIAAMHIAVAPILSAIVPSIQWLVVVNLFTGIGVAGVTLFILNNLLDVSPAEGRPVYLAVHAALVAVSASLAPLAGAWLMSALPVRTALSLCTLFRFVTGLSFFVLLYYQKRQGKGIGPGVAKRSSPEATT